MSTVKEKKEVNQKNLQPIVIGNITFDASTDDISKSFGISDEREAEINDEMGRVGDRADGNVQLFTSESVKIAKNEAEVAFIALKVGMLMGAQSIFS